MAVLLRWIFFREHDAHDTIPSFTWQSKSQESPSVNGAKDFLLLLHMHDAAASGKLDLTDAFADAK